MENNGIGFLPENRGESPAFQIPTDYEVGNGVATPKAYAGHNKKSQYFFYTIEEYNKKKSDEAGHEIKDVIEICEFKNDSKCSPAHRIDASLFSLHPEILQDYQRWKQGKVSDITEVRNWTALTVGEMGNCIACGYYSVEQIAASTDTELMILGLGWKDIKIKAAQHMKKKDMARRGEAEKTELTHMQTELAKRDAELAELRAMVMELKPKQAKVTLESIDAESELIDPLNMPEVAPAKVIKAKPSKGKAKRKVGLQE
jgi:hypothetical protein